VSADAHLVSMPPKGLTCWLRNEYFVGVQLHVGPDDLFNAFEQHRIVKNLREGIVEFDDIRIVILVWLVVLCLSIAQKARHGLP
jgi:hypothetical protein